MYVMRTLTACLSLATLAACPMAPHDTVYFLVSDPNGPYGDSYILPLDDPGDIAHARALIVNPDTTGAHIAVARIERGAGDPSNRNVTGDGEAWSWHVSEFVGFADYTIEIYDGWPGYVEGHLDEWMENTNGHIGFWSYTVTEELHIRSRLVI